MLHKPNLDTLPEEGFVLLQSKSGANRNKYIAGRNLARTLIAELTGEEESKIIISVDANGQPHHVHHNPVKFSISHSGNLTVVAAMSGKGMCLGIDVEQCKPGRAIETIAKSWFHPLECRLLENATDNKTRLRLFYKLWTAKEAWVKARGLSVWNIGSIPPLEFVPNFGSGLWLELPGNYTLAFYTQEGKDFCETSSSTLCGVGDKKDYIQKSTLQFKNLPPSCLTHNLQVHKEPKGIKNNVILKSRLCSEAVISQDFYAGSFTFNTGDRT